MIFDASTYIGHWPFRKLAYQTLFALDNELKTNHIKKAIVTNINAVFYKNTMEGNLELIDAISKAKYETEFLPFAVINPKYICWREDLLECKRLGFKGIELSPGYHKYKLNCDEAKELYKLCGSLELICKIVSGYEDIRGRHPFDTFEVPQGDEIFELCASSELTSTIICGYYNYDLGDALRAEANKRDNILFDISRLDTYNNPTLENTFWFVGEDKMCFSSFAPFLYIKPQLVKLFHGALKDEAIEKIEYKNLQRIFGEK